MRMKRKIASPAWASPLDLSPPHSHPQAQAELSSYDPQCRAGNASELLSPSTGTAHLDGEGPQSGHRPRGPLSPPELWRGSGREGLI